MRLDPLYYTIVATDVERSSRFNDVSLLRMRRDLRELLADSLARQGIDMASLPVIDDGDGFRILLPAEYSPHVALDPFVGRLSIEMREHRSASSESNRLRLRIAVHSGLLHREAGGAFAGTPLKDCARML